MGRTKESVDHLHWLFSDIKKTKSKCQVLVLLVMLYNMRAVNATYKTQ